jgi:hypothetical protein
LESNSMMMTFPQLTLYKPFYSWYSHTTNASRVTCSPKTYRPESSKVTL